MNTRLAALRGICERTRRLGTQAVAWRFLDALRHSSRIWIASLAIVLALSFLGTRGIWDPDEGRYTNVAVNMLASGDWLNPHRSEDVGHWTKPPLTYWAVASSLGIFGLQPWAARLPMALSYLLCVWLAYRMARRLAPGSETTAAVAYATMLLPFGASQVVTTDIVLAACTGIEAQSRERMAGIVLTGGLRPDAAVLKVIRAMPIPVLLAEEGSYQVASKVHDLNVKTRPDDAEKISLIRDIVATNVNVKRIVESL